MSGGGTELWTVTLKVDNGQLLAGKLETFLRSPYIKIYPAFSPDGRWLAYASNESGASEIYVRPFPEGALGARAGWQISTGGGSHPIWSPNARELFFRGADSRIWVVTYTVHGDSFIAGKPHAWSEQRLMALLSPPVGTYDLAPGGKRFAAILYTDGTAEQKPITRLTFLLNFFDELRRRVPPDGK
jgi:serine/threonine-protein kinase